MSMHDLSTTAPQAAIECIPYCSAFATKWDSFLANVSDGHFFHSRKFLSYHGDRFRDESVLLARAEHPAQTIGLFPAAAHPVSDRVVVSHPGATFGGLVHNHNLRGARMDHAVEALTHHYAQRGYRELVVRLMPSFYSAQPSGELEYALWRAGGRISTLGLSSTVSLSSPRRESSGLRRDTRYGGRLLEIQQRTAPSQEFWDMLEENLRTRHSAKPVHSLAELVQLCGLFPDSIRTYESREGDRLLAGLIVFAHRSVWHVQYMAASEAGRRRMALYATIAAVMNEAERGGVETFDFGISTTHQGQVLNSGLHEFKQKFGAGSTLYRELSLELN